MDCTLAGLPLGIPELLIALRNALIGGRIYVATVTLHTHVRSAAEAAVLSAMGVVESTDESRYHLKANSRCDLREHVVIGPR